MMPVGMVLAKLEFSSGLGPGLLVLLFFVCAALVILFYHRVYTYLGPSVVWALTGLRVLGIAILLILIFRPVLSYDEQISHRMRLYVLLDSSRSMSINDFPNSPNRLAEAIGRVQNHLEELNEGFRLTLYTFDTTVREQRSEKWPEPDGAATNIVRAVKDIVAIAPRGDTAGIVLMTDGIHNAGGNLLRTVEELSPPPIYTVAMGSSLKDESGFQD
ncbi:MAG: VWA domain-containing protein, partial [Phycisphaerae bacterium]|nr:VWA domain-containing protein [Phycisphaerae bacterium]